MEILTIAFSTFFGASVALGAERLSRLRDDQAREYAAINSLILDLASKRAFLASDHDWNWLDGEMKRVIGSIFHARDLVREARLSVRPRSDSLPILRNMIRHCNRFVELTEREDDDSLKDALRHLTRSMAFEVEALHGLRPRHIIPDAPGSFALPTQTERPGGG